MNEETLLVDLGSVFHTCADAWEGAMTEPGGFSIADALGVDLTAAVLNSRLAGHTPLLGALEGVVRSLKQKPDHVQQLVLDGHIQLPGGAGTRVTTRAAAAADRWIVESFRSAAQGSVDPLGSVDQDIVDELTAQDAFGNAGVMSGYLAAITLVGAAANFPDDDVRVAAASNELVELADVSAGVESVTRQQVQFVFNNFGAGTINVNASSGAAGPQVVAGTPASTPAPWYRRFDTWIFLLTLIVGVVAVVVTIVLGT